MQLTGLQVGVWGQTAGWCVGSDGWLVCGIRRQVGVWDQTAGWCVGSDGRLVCGVRMHAQATHLQTGHFPNRTHPQNGHLHKGSTENTPA